MIASSLLRKSAELIAPDGCWCQGALARDRNGRPHHFSSPAVSYCPIGAIESLKGEDITAALEAEEAICRLVYGESWLTKGFGTWNDDPERTQDEVVALLLCAADVLEEQDK